MNLTSVLFPRGEAPPDAEAPPDCFHDLRLGDIIAAVCEGYPDDRVMRLFYQPLREVSAVEHRHKVFRELERGNVRQSITDFTDAMATMRGQLRQAEWVQYRWQRHGWFTHAVFTFCNAVNVLRDTKARHELVALAGRDPDLARTIGEVAERFEDLQRALITQWQPAGTDLDPALIDDQAFAVSRFITGVMGDFVRSDETIYDVAHLDSMIQAILEGIRGSCQRATRA